MPQIRRSADRGHFDHGWLKTYHTFSFADYRDPKFVHFKSLRVINEDRVQPGEGFGTHPHEDMEIITYVLEGALEHKDSMGNGSVIRPGEVQKMSAGTGITHSEFNPSKEDAVHLLQLWIFPDQKGLKPGYEQKTFSDSQKEGKLLLIGSQDGRAGSVTIHQDVNLFASILKPDSKLEYRNHPSRSTWIHVARGELETDAGVFVAGDALSLQESEGLKLTTSKGAEFLLFDLA